MLRENRYWDGAKTKTRKRNVNRIEARMSEWVRRRERERERERARERGGMV